MKQLLTQNRRSRDPSCRLEPWWGTAEQKKNWIDMCKEILCLGAHNDSTWSSRQFCTRAEKQGNEVDGVEQEASWGPLQHCIGFGVCTVEMYSCYCFIVFCFVFVYCSPLSLMTIRGIRLPVIGRIPSRVAGDMMLRSCIMQHWKWTFMLANVSAYASLKSSSYSPRSKWRNACAHLEWIPKRP